MTNYLIYNVILSDIMDNSKLRIRETNTGNCVHKWDGKLTSKYYELIRLDDKYLSTPHSYEMCMNEILDECYTIDDKKIRKTIINVIEKIKGSPGDNKDITNNISFEEILPRVWKFYRLMPNTDKAVFFEQIFDMHTGMCPQGRVGMRMFQLYASWIESLDVYLKDAKLLDNDVRNIFAQLKNDNL